jgi:pyocin large subunit-like protein
MQNASRSLIVTAALILAIVFGINHLSHDPRLQPPAPHGTIQTGTVVWSHGPDGSVANADEHWRKHGAEFPEFHSEQDYVAGALAFVTTPPPGTLIKHDERGDTLFYNPATNTFAVRDDRGEPRTFFRPDNGRAYWDHQ